MKYFTPALVLTALIFGIMASPAQAYTTTADSFAVLPFTIHADRDMDYIKKGISRMLFSRLTWPGKVEVVPFETIMPVQTSLKNMPSDKQILETAQKTGSRYVLSGSITQFDGSFSIDARVFDIRDKRYMAFFERSEKSDDLIDRVDRIAANINQRIFDRTTVTWKKMEQEREKYLQDLKRKNPEHLMQTPPNWQPEEEIGWKIWKYLF